MISPVAAILSMAFSLIVFFVDWHHWSTQPEWLTIAGGAVAVLFGALGLVLLIVSEFMDEINERLIWMNRNWATAQKDQHRRELRIARARLWTTGWQESARREPKEKS